MSEFKFYHPQSYLNRIKKIILPKRDDYQAASALKDAPSVSISNYIISSEYIQIYKELGVGEFGVVKQGVWTNEEGERIQVAIKCLSADRMQNSSNEFLKEASIMHSISHPSIVRLYGVVLDASSLMLITELAPLRSLLECLKEPALRFSFPIISLCQFAQQIAEGMAYLESKRLIHRDLAARNILVFARNKVKISDFGLSRALGVGKDYYQTNFNVNLKLPIAWCAPECINYLKFTSASDVWAFAVTLWEMFSYGFQPWAALTGQQILESIDEPHYQRLEQPECCPQEYYSLMLKCWNHDPNLRPKFSDISSLLPDCKPELVQVTKSFNSGSKTKGKKDYLSYKVGDIITVLDKKPETSKYTVGISSQEMPAVLWKGALNSGKTGLFSPTDVISYLGPNLPALTAGLAAMSVSNEDNYSRTSDAKSANLHTRRKLKANMISRPQRDFRHMGHIGIDGALFGDVDFLAKEYHQLPKQVVVPYRAQDDQVGDYDRELYHDTQYPAQTCREWKAETHQNSSCHTQHEYHEISDEEENGCLESPPFETLDFGPSLMDEVFKELDNIRPEYTNEVTQQEIAINESGTNVKNEIREITTKMCKETKKKQATVKPISAAEQMQLDSAIAMAKDIASRSMLALDCEDELSESPKTPTSPTKRNKFSFKFKSSPKPERRNFSSVTDAIGDIENTFTEEAKEAYNTLVEKGEGLSCDYKHDDRKRSDASYLLRAANKNLQLLNRSKLGIAPPVPMSDCQNALPLPPRDHTKPLLQPLKHHQRKHPLVLPTGTASSAIVNEQDNNGNSQTKSNISNNPVSEYIAKVEVVSGIVPPPKPARSYFVNSDAFDSQTGEEINNLDNVPNVPSLEKPESEIKKGLVNQNCDTMQSDPPTPVTSEPPGPNLLDSATDPTSSPGRLINSADLDRDEVRIVQKVLAKEVQLTPEECVIILDSAKWDVHRAIKCVRLRQQIRQHNIFVECNWAELLEKFRWNVRHACNYYIANKNIPPDGINV